MIMNIELVSKWTEYFNLKRYFISPSCPEKTVERETTKTAYVNSVFLRLNVQFIYFIIFITMLSGACLCYAVVLTDELLPKPIKAPTYILYNALGI